MKFFFKVCIEAEKKFSTNELNLIRKIQRSESIFYFFFCQNSGLVLKGERKRQTCGILPCADNHTVIGDVKLWKVYLIIQIQGRRILPFEQHIRSRVSV